MTRRYNTLVCAILFSYGVSLLAANANQNQGKQVPTKAPTKSMMPMPLVAPLFIEDDRRESVITMVNDAPDPVTLDVVLLNAAGGEIAKRSVTIEPHATRSAVVADILTSASAAWPMIGSVVLQPNRPSTMAAQLSISGRDGTLSDDIEEEFSMMMDEKPANFRAVTTSAEPVLAIRSMASAPQTVTITCLTDRKRSVVLDSSKMTMVRPNSLVLVRACGGDADLSLSDEIDHLTRAVAGHATVGIAVASQAKSNELAVFGLGAVKIDNVSHLGAVPFTDTNDLATAAAIYPGAFFSSNDSYMGPRYALRALLANFDQAPRTATVSAVYGGTEKVIETIHLAPGEVAATDMLTMPAGSNASLKVASDGQPGAVMSGVEATTGSSAFVSLPWKDQGMKLGGGQHPWRTDGGFHSTLLLNNPAPGDAGSVVVNVHAKGQLWKKDFTVAAGTTLSVSIDDIVSRQLPDSKGDMLPRTATNGLTTWLTTGKTKVFGMLLQNNPAVALVRPYACAEYYAVCAVVLSTLNLQVQGSSDNSYATAAGCGTWGDCSCVESCGSGGTSSLLYAWSSGNSGIAQLTSSPSYSFGQYKGVAVGFAHSELGVTDNLSCSAENTGDIYVWGPASSRLVSTTSNYSLSSGQSPCASGQAGWYRTVTKAVVDGHGSDVAAAGQALTETVTLGSPNDLGISSIATGYATTNSAGQFSDTLYVCSSACPSSGGHTVASQVITDIYSGTTYTLSTNSFNYTCGGITINGQ